jgi:hypothetical protein
MMSVLIFSLHLAYYTILHVTCSFDVLRLNTELLYPASRTLTYKMLQLHSAPLQ